MADIDESWDYPRETEEFVFFDELLINGMVPTGEIEFALTRGLDRPNKEEYWGPVVEQAGRKCFLLQPQEEPGRVKVWARVKDQAEKTVIEVGFINIT